MIVDDMAIAYTKEPDNGVPISSWKGDKEDKQLEELLPFLELLAKVEDVRMYLKKFNRGNKIDFKRAIPILKQDIDNIKNKLSFNTESRSRTSNNRLGYSESYRAISKAEYAVNKWKQMNSNNIAKPNKQLDVDLLKNYSSQRHISLIPNNHNVRQPPSIMNKAYELANKHYTTPRVTYHSESLCRGQGYGVYKIDHF